MYKVLIREAPHGILHTKYFRYRKDAVDYAVDHFHTSPWAPKDWRKNYLILDEKTNGILTGWQHKLEEK